MTEPLTAKADRDDEEELRLIMEAWAYSDGSGTDTVSAAGEIMAAGFRRDPALDKRAIVYGVSE